MPSAGFVLRAAALGFFVLCLVTAVPPTVVRSLRWAARAVSLAAEDSPAARRRALGGAWVSAIEKLRRTIPRDGEYLLVNGGLESEGGPLWVRFELAPRRARFLGLAGELPDAATLRRTFPRGPRWVVIAFRDTQPPTLMERDELLRAFARHHGGV